MSSSPRRKKVVIIPSWYPSQETPINGIFVQEQAACLARRFDVTVLTPRFPSLKDLICLRLGPQQIEEDSLGLAVWRLRKIKIPSIWRLFPFWPHPDLVLAYYRKYLSAVRRGFDCYRRRHGLPDIVHAHVVLPGGWAAVQLGKDHGVPVVLTEHSGPFSMHLTTPRQRALVQQTLNQVARVVAVSPSLAQTIREFSPGLGVQVIGNIVRTEFFTPAETSPLPGKRLGFFVAALLSEQKGVQYLLKASQLLLRQGWTSFEVVVGGQGPYRLFLEKMAADLGVQDHCRFVGFLDRHPLRERMRACDVFVLPSLGETFGLVLGEAMACGKPVLSTRCGGPEYLVTPETGVLVPPANAQQLAEAMAGFLERRFVFASDRIRDSVVSRFGETTFLEKTAQLYQEASYHKVQAA